MIYPPLRAVFLGASPPRAPACVSLAAPGLRCGAWVLSKLCGAAPWLRLAALHLAAVLSLVAEHRLSGAGLSGCGSRVQSLQYLGLVVHGMWDLPRRGIEPMSLALQGEFLTREVPVEWFLISLVYGLIVYTPKII